MQLLQPELKQLQAKYKDDRQKINEEMMKFYEEHKVNPLAGCLPLLLQLPVFIILYRLIHRPAAEARGNGRAGRPRLDSELLQGPVTRSGKMLSLGIDLAEPAGDRSTAWQRLPLLLLVVGIVATSYFQQRQMTGPHPTARSIRRCR